MKIIVLTIHFACIGCEIYWMSKKDKGKELSSLHLSKMIIKFYQVWCDHNTNLMGAN